MVTTNDLVKMGACPEAVEFARTRPSLFDAWEECDRPPWLVWYARRKIDVEKITWVKVAVFAAEKALPYFESKYPNDSRPRKAIEAAKNWIDNPTPENVRAVYGAEADAFAAAASTAAFSASAAAYAASAVASISSHFAASAAYGASASACAVPENKQIRIEICDYIRSLVGNPFSQQTKT